MRITIPRCAVLLTLILGTGSNVFSQTTGPDTTTWIGNGSNFWDDTNQWDNGVPTSSINAILSSAVADTAVVRSSAPAFALDVDLQNMTLEVQTGGELNVGGNLTVQSSTNSANLNVAGEISVSGTFGDVGVYFGSNINLDDGSITSADLVLDWATVAGTGTFTADSGTIGSDSVIRPGDAPGDIGQVKFVLADDTAANRVLDFSGDFDIDVSATGFDEIRVEDPVGMAMVCADTVFDVSATVFNVNEVDPIAAGTEFDVFFTSGEFKFGGFDVASPGIDDIGVTAGYVLSQVDVFEAGVKVGEALRLTAVPEPTAIMPLLLMLVGSGSVYRRRRSALSDNLDGFSVLD